MKIELLLLGKTKERYIDSGIQDYCKRLSRYTSIKLRYIKAKSSSGKSAEQIKAYESTLLNAHMVQSGYRVALDSNGRQLNSESFATFLSKREQQPVKRLYFIIGGPLGLADEQQQEADTVLSLSKMTFTHDMIRLLLLEQLYRAYTIKAGEKYHK